MAETTTLTELGHQTLRYGVRHADESILEIQGEILKLLPVIYGIVQSVQHFVDPRVHVGADRFLKQASDAPILR